MSNDHFSVERSRFKITRFSLATLFVLVTAIAVAIAVGIELSKTEVSAVIWLRRSAADSTWPKSWLEGEDLENYEHFCRTQVELLRSRMLLTRALRDSRVGGDNFVGREANPVDWLRTNLKFEFLSDSELLQISLLSHDPPQAAAVVNAIVDTYFKEVVEQEYQKRSKAEQRLQKLYQDMSEQLIRDKKDNATLAEALGDDAKSSVELEMRLKKERRSEENLDDVSRQLHLLQMKRQMPSRVQRLDEASAEP